MAYGKTAAIGLIHQHPFNQTFGTLVLALVVHGHPLLKQDRNQRLFSRIVRAPINEYTSQATSCSPGTGTDTGEPQYPLVSLPGLGAYS